MTSKRIKCLLGGLVLMGLVCGDARAESLVTWDYRAEIRVAAEIPGVLTNFPALVVLHPENIDGFEYADFANAEDGADLRFTDAAETTVLNHEIEVWNTNGSSLVWVQIPEIDGTNTIIHAYWGKADAVALPGATNGAVWSEGFAAVWHMGQSGTRVDATMNGNDGVVSGSVTPVTDGKVGPADDFSGGNINCGNVSITGDQTIEMWVYPTGLGPRRNPLNKAYGGEGTITLENNAALTYFWGTAGGDAEPYQGVSSIASLPANTWTHIALVRDLSSPSRTVRWYFNGQMVNSETASYTAAAASPADLLLGAGYTDPFQGRLDEVRMSTAARGPNWVWATWLNQASNDVFLAYSEAKRQATNLSVTARQVSDRGPTSATFNGIVLHAGEAENPDVYFCWGSSDGMTNATTDWEHVIAMGADWGWGDEFSTNVTGLLSGSTYVYRAYVTNTAGEAWSDAITFTTAALPDVTNAGPAWVRRRKARLDGELLDAGFQSPNVWIEYWPDGGAITSSVDIGTFSEQLFDVLLESLDPATEYHYRFGASNTAGVVWSALDGFTTLTGDPIGWYVATDGLNASGLDWENAFNTPQMALAVAEPGDTIYLAGHLFPLDSQIEWTVSGVTVEGGYEAVSGAPGNRDPESWQTVLTRADTGVSHRLLHISGVATGMLSGVVVSNGYAYGVHPFGSGGGIWISDTTDFTLADCTIVTNRIRHDTSNGYDIYGAGIYIANSTVAIRNTLFLRNRGETISTSTYANSHGGGLFASGGLVTIEDCFFFGNTLASDYNVGWSLGAGISINGDHRVTRTVFDGNQLIGGRNRVGANIYIANGSPTIENTILSRGNYHGLYQNAGTAELINCTIVSNATHGVYRNGGSIAIRNSILWNNGTDIAEAVAGNVSLTYSSSSQGVNVGSDGCVDDDPLFVDWTHFHLESAGGHYTNGYFSGGGWEVGTVYSPLIDAGDPASPFNREPSPGGARVNMGAYGNTSVASLSPPLTVTNHPVSGLGLNQATLRGELLHMGDPDVEIRFYWGTSNGETDTGAWGQYVEVGTLTGSGLFSKQLTGLTPGMTYWYAVRAVNATGTVAWAQPSLSFTPQVSQPEVINTGVENDDTALVTLKGEVTTTGGDAPQVYICWGATEGDTSDTNTWENVVSIGPQSGAFAHDVSVIPGSNYFYTVYAVNAAGSAWGQPPLPFGLHHIRYVDATAIGTGSGYSWSNAFTSLQAALNSTTDSKTNYIHVRGGDYVVISQLNWTGSHVRVLGGYAADGMPGTRDPAQWPTVIRNPDRNIRIVSISGARDVLLDGVTLKGGNMPGTGGGILITAAEDVTLQACRMTDNSAIGHGGGVGIVHSTNVLISGSRIDRNRATDAGGNRFGGGVFIEGGSGTISNTVVEWNSARNGEHNRGGGLYIHGGAWVVRDSHVRYNTALRAEWWMNATFGGGVVLTGGGDAVFINCVIAQNHSIWHDGIWHENGTALFENCSIVGNDGYGVVGSAATTVRNSILWNNTVDIVGAVNLEHNNIETGVGEGVNSNISIYPQFERGLYLASDSPCRAVGDRTVTAAGLEGYTTQADGTPAVGGDMVDLGFHATAGIDPATADLYVAPSGDDANGGADPGDPLLSITHALSRAVEGSRIHLAAGVYDIATETFPLNVNRIGMQLLGADALTTVLDASDSQQRALVLSDLSFGLISKLTVRGGGYAPYFNVSGAGIYAWNANQLTIANAIISDNISGYHGGGVAIFNSADVRIRASRIENNILDAARRDQLHYGGGFYAESSSGVIAGSFICNNRARNTVHGHSNTRNQGGGIAFNGGSWRVEETVIDGNVVDHSIADWLNQYGGGVHVAAGAHEMRSSLIVSNRVIRQPGQEFAHGLSVHGGALTMINCTVVDHPGEGLRRENAAAVAITNSIFWNNGIDYANPALDGEGRDPAVAWSNFEQGLNDGFNGCISADPLFADAANGDFRLRPGISPGIDAGINLSWMASAKDLQGFPRLLYGIRSVTVDMGAYETEPVPGSMIRLR